MFSESPQTVLLSRGGHRIKGPNPLSFQMGGLVQQTSPRTTEGDPISTDGLGGTEEKRVR